MNALSMPFRQLVDRKLWPLAILLIAALAAVPMLLAKEDTSVPTPPAGLGAGATQLADASVTQPIVTLGEPTQRESRRKVLGARKDPFEPAVKAKKADTTTTTTTTTAKTDTGTTGKTGGSGTGTTSTPPVVGVNPVTEPAKKKTYELFALKIRFGSTSSDDLANRSIKRLTALPKMDEPVLVYLGLKKDLKTAVFLVDANTLVVGDGKCLPSPVNCQNLELKKGQTAFVDVLDEEGNSTAQYELDFVKVLKKATSDAEAAKASRRSVAKGGRDALRANISRVNGWKFDPETGVLIPPDGE
jgi:hypothetical protein